MRRVFCSKWKYLPWPPGKYFRHAAIPAGQWPVRQNAAGTLFPIRRKIDV